ncbi:MAG: response regulator [bacterium]
MSEKRKILVTDDDPDVAEQLRMILTGQGYEVASAASHKEAEELLMGFQPDLAIVDLMMEQPDSGFVLCHQIRKLYPETPIILLTSVTAQTGMSFDTQSESARSWIQADTIMDKPVRAEQLRAEVNRLLRIPATAGHATH